MYRVNGTTSRLGSETQFPEQCGARPTTPGRGRAPEGRNDLPRPPRPRRPHAASRRAPAGLPERGPCGRASRERGGPRSGHGGGLSRGRCRFRDEVQAGGSHRSREGDCPGRGRERQAATPIRASSRPNLRVRDTDETPQDQPARAEGDGFLELSRLPEPHQYAAADRDGRGAAGTTTAACGADAARRGRAAGTIGARP